jgi:uncharacterized delta-60 repeat protein/uncharacterized repeat protein (TIGR01451 family)
MLGGAIALLPMLAQGAAGDLDCSFGTGGIVTHDLVNGEGAFDAALQPDGKIVFVGSPGGGVRLTRLLPGGDLDPTFGNNGTIVHPFVGLQSAWRVDLDSQGRIVVGGRMANPDTDAFVARFTATGAIDTAFGGGDGWHSFDFTPATSGVGTDNVTGLAIDASDRPVVGGYADANAQINPSDSNIAVARLTTAGALDPAFGGGDGIVTASSPTATRDDDSRAIAIDALGRIIATGSTYSGNPSNNGPRRTILARFTSAGELDPTFGSAGVAIHDVSLAATDNFGHDIVVDGSGRAVVLSSVGNDPTLSRYQDNGALDATFSGDGVVQRSFVGGQDVIERVLIQADGKLLVTGWPVVGTSFHLASMRFTDVGVLDTTWGGTGVVTTSVGFNERAYSAVLQANQRLVLLGGLNNDQNMVAVRYLADGDTLSPTSTAITGDSPDPSQVGETVTVGVAVTALTGSGAPSGQVVVTDGPATCIATLGASATAIATGSCALAPATAGMRTLTAQFGGSATMCRSGASAPHQVDRATTTTAITADTPDPSAAGDAFTVQYSVTAATGTPSGNVTVSDGVDSCTASVAAGGCELTLTTAGTRALVASYAGDAGFANSSSASATHAVHLRVTPSPGANGALAPATPVLVALNATTTFTALPAEGYHVEAITGCAGSRNGNAYTTGPVTTHCTVSATFNADPVANAGTLTVLEDSGANAGVLSGSDADPLTFAIASLPSLGTVQITNAATGAYQYTPAVDATGADSFTFVVNDGGAASAPAVVALTITPVNDAPSVSFGPLPVHPAGTSGPQAVPGHALFDAGPADEDAAQGVLAYAIDAVDDPAGVLAPGSAVIAADGTLAYALTGVGGSATLTARVQDDGGTANGGVDTSAAATFQIAVTPGADLQVAKSNDVGALVDGQTTVYAIVVANAGPNAASGVTLSDVLPATLTDATWACQQQQPQTPCPTPTAGSGDLLATIDLPVDGFLRFDLMATVAAAGAPSIANTASATPPAGVTAIDTSNDSATDQDLAVPDGVLADGFESATAGLSVSGAAEALRLP